MRLAVISDIHGNLPALEATLADLERSGGADLLWHLGDYAAFGVAPSACIQRVREHAAAFGEDKVRFIGGNTDRYLVNGERFKGLAAEDEEAFGKLSKNRRRTDDLLNWGLDQLTWDDYQWLAGLLGKELSVDVPDYGGVIGYHAVPGNDEAFLTPETAEEEAADHLLDREGRLAIGGHIHVQMHRLIGDWRVVNVGSVGAANIGGEAHWGLFTFDDDAVTVDLRAVPYNTQALIDALKASDFPHPDWSLKYLRIG